MEKILLLTEGDWGNFKGEKICSDIGDCAAAEFQDMRREFCYNCENGCPEKPLIIVEYLGINPMFYY